MALPDKRLRQKTSASASATDTKGGTREKVEKMKPAKPITKVRKNLKADEAKAKTKKKQEKAGMKEKKDKKEKKADKEKPDKKEKNAEKVKKDKKDNNAEKEKPDKKEKNAEKEKPDKKEKKAEKEKPDKKEKNTEKEKKDKKEKSAEQETQERKKAEEIKGKIETTAAKRKSQDHEVKESKKPKAAPATKEEKKAQKKEQKKAEKKEKKESKRADKAAKIDEAKETKDEAETPKRPPAIRYVPVEKKKIKPIFETPVPSPSASTGGTSAGTARTPTSTAMERANDKLKELTSMLESSQSPSEPDDAEMMFGAMIAEQKEEREKEAEENGETSDTTGEEEEDDDDDDKEDKVAEEEEDEEPSQEMSDDEYDGEEMTGEELEGLLAQSPVYDPETDEDEEEEEEEEEESEDQDDQEEDEEEAEDETKVQDKEDDKDKHALVPVTQATAFGTKLLRNSTTNKREYDTFVRQIKSSGKFPTQLSEFAQTNRLELFNIWMNTGCSWDSCCLEVERLQTTKNQTIRGWRAVQGKELRPKYTEDKFNKLISARRDAGLFYEDQDFPGDIDECWYFMRVGEEIKNKSVTADRLKLAASKQVDDTLRQSLTDQDEGILRPGALPKIEGVSASASKALASSFGQVAAPKKKPKEKAEKVEATSAKGEAVQRMETLLKDSAAARTSSITLQSVEYAAELSRQLLQHAEALEGFYQRVKLAVEKDEDESFFKSLMVKIKEKEAFGVKAQAAASAMLRSAKAKAKAKAKPKGRKSKNATAKPADDEK